MKNIIENLGALLGADNVISLSNKPAEYQFLPDRINNADREVIAVVTPSNLDELQKRSEEHTSELQSQ